jgi:alkylhydroperoxidase family enzyme
MQRFELQTVESAPEKSQPALKMLQEKFGYLPNALATMANQPVLLNAFVGVFGGFHGGSFDEIEKQVLLLTNAVTIKCPWTVAAHSTFAVEDGIDEGEVEAIRQGKLPKDPKYAALSGLTKALIENKGNATEAEIGRFTAAGYSKLQVLEVVAGIGVSTIAATTTNLAGTPIEARFQPRAWTPAAVAA